jgi:thiamine biosynthesis lipoprotein
LRAPPAGGALPSVYRTHALGTTAELLVTEPSTLLAASELLHEELERIDRVASRFRPDSELSELNASAGQAVRVSPDLYEAIAVALLMAESTEGRVDPTVGRAVVALGYDRDFASVARGVDGELPPRRRVPGWRLVTAEPRRRMVTLPPGTMLDLGATAKALAADRSAEAIHRGVGCGVLVSLGGDVAVAGPPPAEGFAVGVADACTAQRHGQAVAIRTGGLASSGTGVRRWRLGDHCVHHIVDPATGLPAPEYWRTVTTTAASCVQANAAATASVVMGAAAADWLEELRIAARFVRTDGSVLCTSRWPASEASEASVASVADQAPVR